MILLYAVTLSSSDTVTFVVSSMLTRDLKNYTQKYSDESMKRMTRFLMLTFVVFAVVIGVYYQDIMSLGFSLASLNIALFPVVFGSLYWTFHHKAVFWSLVLALLSVIILFAGRYLNPQTAVISLPVALVSLIIFQKVLQKKSDYALPG